MEKILEMFTKEDLYNIIVPLITAIGGWILSYLVNMEKFECGWKCTRRKSNSMRYAQYLFVTVFLSASVLRVLAVVIIGLIEIELFTYFNITLPNMVIEVIRSLISLSYIIWMIYYLEIDMDKYNFKKCIKFQVVFVKFLYYLPLILCMWILGVTNIFNLPIIDFIINVLLVLIELIALFYFNSEEKYSYEYATFKFKDIEIEDINTKNIYQKGTWIVFEDFEKDREIRCRQKDLVNVIYQNKSTRKPNKGIKINKKEEE